MNWVEGWAEVEVKGWETDHQEENRQKVGHLGGVELAIGVVKESVSMQIRQ